MAGIQGLRRDGSLTKVEPKANLQTPFQALAILNEVLVAALMWIIFAGGEGSSDYVHYRFTKKPQFFEMFTFVGLMCSHLCKLLS